MKRQITLGAVNNYPHLHKSKKFTLFTTTPLHHPHPPPPHTPHRAQPYKNDDSNSGRIKCHNLHLCSPGLVNPSVSFLWHLFIIKISKINLCKSGTWGHFNPISSKPIPDYSIFPTNQLKILWTQYHRMGRTNTNIRLFEQYFLIVKSVRVNINICQDFCTWLRDVIASLVTRKATQGSRQGQKVRDDNIPFREWSEWRL